MSKPQSGLKVQYGVSTLAVTVGRARFTVVVHGKATGARRKWSWRAEGFERNNDGSLSGVLLDSGSTATWQAAQRAAFRACEAQTQRRK